jgi:hypothetical protein
MPKGWSEFYLHPGAEPEVIDYEFIHELICLEGIELVSSADLAA